MNALRRLPRLPRLSHAFARTIRPVATAPHHSTTIHGLLAAATAANPLKDAVKFIAPAKSTIWTYRELESHVSALATGLNHLGYSNQTILALLPPSSPEYPILLLAAARVAANLIPIPPPADPASLDVHIIRDALGKHRPYALFVANEYYPTCDLDDDGIVASVNPILHALDPEVALDDAAGRDGFVPLTGRPFRSRNFPFLKHVVHTGDTNMRASITFKSLLVYSGEPIDSSAAEGPILTSDGAQLTEKRLIQQAHKLGEQLGLSSDHTTKEGKLVIKPGLGQSTATALVAALMHESLWVSPGTQDSTDVSSTENALVA